MSSDRTLPNDVVAFVERLVALKPRPIAIWLIGSRANDRANDRSDTDLLIFGSNELLSAIRDELVPPEKVDCLVVFNGDEFKDPWRDKAGSLSELKWTPIDDFTATYIGTKSIVDEEDSLDFGDEIAADLGRLVEVRELAFRVWPVSESEMQQTQRGR
jgi:predicted nucleotidyltransferase